jgi:hypothetical protein
VRQNVPVLTSTLQTNTFKTERTRRTRHRHVGFLDFRQGSVLVRAAEEANEQSTVQQSGISAFVSRRLLSTSFMNSPPSMRMSPASRSSKRTCGRVDGALNLARHSWKKSRYWVIARPYTGLGSLIQAHAREFLELGDRDERIVPGTNQLGYALPLILIPGLGPPRNR